MIEQLNCQVFSECLNSVFQVRTGGIGSLTLELVEVKENSTPRLERFTLLFRGPAAPQIQQAIHHLAHEKLGEFDIFLVPVGPDDKGLCYEAIFNRFRE
jgi:hypothetical protein